MSDKTKSRMLGQSSGRPAYTKPEIRTYDEAYLKSQFPEVFASSCFLDTWSPIEP
ncbi:MAG: hypothetical protein AAFX96_09975 [Pseudomonadota bacterium]